MTGVGVEAGVHDGRALDLAEPIPEYQGDVGALLYFQNTHGGIPPFLWLALLVVLYLTVVELRPLEMPMRFKVWWFSLVLLTHVFGYVVLRAYVFFRRRVGPA